MAFIDSSTTNRMPPSKKSDGAHPETNPIVCRTRGYSIVLSRFLQEDPIGYDDGMDKYELEHDNSVNRVDPLGLTSEIDTSKSMSLDDVRKNDSRLAHTVFTGEITIETACEKGKENENGWGVLHAKNDLQIIIYMATSSVTGQFLTDQGVTPTADAVKDKQSSLNDYENKQNAGPLKASWDGLDTALTPKIEAIKNQASQKAAQDAAQALATQWLEQFAVDFYNTVKADYDKQPESFRKKYAMRSFDYIQATVVGNIGVTIDGHPVVAITLPANEPATRPTATQPTTSP